MRLKQYLVEITPSQIPKATAYIENNLASLYRILDKHKWIVTDDIFVKILNGLFNRNKIYFEMSKGKFYISKYFAGATLGYEGDITVYTRKGVAKFIRRFADPKEYDQFFNINTNAFLDGLLYVLAHELIHLKQAGASGGRIFKTPGDSKTSDPLDAEIDYLFDPSEIETHAHDAAMELKKRHGNSGILKMFNKIFKDHNDHPVYKKFLKKMMQYYLGE